MSDSPRHLNPRHRRRHKIDPEREGTDKDCGALKQKWIEIFTKIGCIVLRVTSDQQPIIRPPRRRPSPNRKSRHDRNRHRHGGTRTPSRGRHKSLHRLQRDRSYSSSRRKVLSGSEKDLSGDREDKGSQSTAGLLEVATTDHGDAFPKPNNVDAPLSSVTLCPAGDLRTEGALDADITPETWPEQRERGSPIAPVGSSASVDSLVALKPIKSVEPVKPINSVEPVKPLKSVNPVNPVNPVETVEPLKSLKPLNPVEPVEPVNPVKPVNHGKPINHGKPVEPVEPVESIGSVNSINPVESPASIDSPVAVKSVQSVESVDSTVSSSTQRNESQSKVSSDHGTLGAESLSSPHLSSPAILPTFLYPGSIVRRKIKGDRHPHTILHIEQEENKSPMIWTCICKSRIRLRKIRQQYGRKTHVHFIYFGGVTPNPNFETGGIKMPKVPEVEIQGPPMRKCTYLELSSCQAFEPGDFELFEGVPRHLKLSSLDKVINELSKTNTKLKWLQKQKSPPGSVPVAQPEILMQESSRKNLRSVKNTNSA
ncbi:hypothetical protein FPCIR_11128 [Fusarium pseudocircinatum]|uniref:Uncharacterized protein n=1 Tax=Fusarium pseudocircinatum TaxID=56676 RepID=A0A8H5KWN8_9HYPO|nr:hypothetical protein FPCIR_11128 [Fusarium pseudocircinatum]